MTLGRSLDRYLRLPYSLPSATIAAALDRLGDAWEESQRSGRDAERALQVV